MLKALPPDRRDPRECEIDDLRERVRRLEEINEALIDRVERSSDMDGSYSMFEKAIALETMVRDRTAELEAALEKLADANVRLTAAHEDADAARARLRDAVESLSDGFAIFDAEDRLLMHNRAFLKIWPEFSGGIEQDTTFTELAERLASTGSAVGSRVAPERWVHERVARHREASGAHVQLLSDGRWLQINELRTSEGGTVGIYTDITSVKAEDARQRARELATRNLALQASLDTLSEGACMFDSERRLIAWNETLRGMLGISDNLHEALGTHDRMIEWCVTHRGLDRPSGIEWRNDSGPRISTDCTMMGRHFVIRSVALSGGGMTYAFDDVTDRIRFQRSLTEQAETLERRVAERTAELSEVNRQLFEAKNEAEQANRSKTSFIAAASHDLLQPLNAARLFVSALAERRLAATNRGLVRQSAVALDSVEELLEALLEISRLDAGAIQPEVQPVALDRILTALRIEFAPLARKDGLRFEIAETGLWVRSDLRLLRRILQNFVSNAIRYTEAGSVAVTAQVDGDFVSISVADTGVGIAAEKQDAIFEEFRRLKQVHKSPGMGLGLAIVRRAGAMLGHEISLVSRQGVYVHHSRAARRAGAPPRGREPDDGPGAGGVRRPGHGGRQRRAGAAGDARPPRELGAGSRHRQPSRRSRRRGQRGRRHGSPDRGLSPRRWFDRRRRDRAAAGAMRRSAARHRHHRRPHRRSEAEPCRAGPSGADQAGEARPVAGASAQAGPDRMIVADDFLHGPKVKG